MFDRENQGIGFDPAFDPDRLVTQLPANVEIVPDYYSEKFTHVKADFIVCKMTLEHIRDVAAFVRTVRQSIGDHLDTTVFFQVPDILRILKEIGFWDIYYEHCSYFSLGSLARLFRSQGFQVNGLWKEYGDQYLMIDGQPVETTTQAALPQEDDLEIIAAEVENFAQEIQPTLDRWKQAIQKAVHQGKKVVLWGSGSKGVSFLTSLNICNEIKYTVDVNPYKKDTFLPGTGQQVVSPEFLQEYRPDLVILMNPVYLDEIRADLSSRGLSPEIWPVGV
jgi:hypothetical protein